MENFHKAEQSGTHEPVPQSKRKRTPISITKANQKRMAAIDDPLEFRANKCSPRARMIHSGTENFHYELWIDQHYHIREQQGDDEGKRDGIDPHFVESLIMRAFKHLLLYSAFIKGFKFLNHEDGKNRIVLRENDGNGMLNIPIEAHYLDINKFEITVKTAMRGEDFRIQAGEYVLELFNDNGSALQKFENGKLNKVCSF